MLERGGGSRLISSGRGEGHERTHLYSLRTYTSSLAYSNRLKLEYLETHEIAGVPSGGGIRRGLATLHAGLDGSRPVEQQAGPFRVCGKPIEAERRCKKWAGEGNIRAEKNRI